jgi:tetratricopeptide (TPR) repeat protein
VRPVPVPVSQDWAQRIQENPELCDTPEFSAFLGQHRAYAETTGDPEYINKTFNNLSTSIIRADSRRATFAVSLIEEALEWAPWNPHNWTSYAIVLCAAHRAADAINALWKARQRFPWNPIVRNELGRILRASGDLPAAQGVLREAVSHFPFNVVARHSLAAVLIELDRFDDACAVYRQACSDFPDQQISRNLLAETLHHMGRFDEAREVYEKTSREFSNDIVCLTGWADVLIDVNRIDAAESIYLRALEIDNHNPYARGGLARVFSLRSARNRDEELRDEAKRILRELADEGNQDARSRLRDFDDQWERATTDTSVTFRRETRDRQPQARRTPHGRTIAEMSVAERLGRAMITLWQAERAEDAALRSSLCAHATELLEVPEDEIDDDLLAAFVETRGLVFLASGDARRALTYFEEQIHHYGRGGWIGIQLGDQRARIVLGVPKDADDTVEAPSSQSARFALYVARVIQILSASPQESEVRDLLKTLYPRAADYAARAQPDAEGGLSIESGAEMLGAFLQTRWFRPAGIQSAADLERPDVLHTVVERINTTRTDTFDAISNSAMALAA